MFTLWKAVDPKQAKSNPLYGVRGWLLVFAAALFLGVLLEVGSALREAREAGITLSELFDLKVPEALFIKRVIWCKALGMVAIYFMLFTKSSAFRVGSTLLLAAHVPVVVLLFIAEPFALPPFEPTKTLASSLVSCAVWVAYLNRSRRVRLTFEHSERADANAEVAVDQGIPGGAGHPIAASSEAARNGRSTPPGAGVDSLTQESAGPTDAHWSAALTELNSAARQSGLWARCFSRAGGVESAAQAAYLEERAQQLHLAENETLRQRLVEQAAQERLTEQRARLDPNIVPAVDLFQHVMLNGRAPVHFAGLLIRMLGGEADPRGFWKPGWRVAFDGVTRQFDSDEEFAYWFNVDGLEAVRKILTTHGVKTADLDMRAAICPNCSAKVAVLAVRCLRCNASFESESKFRPTPV